MGTMLSVLASGLVGLVPNCAASIVIAQLYLEGVLGAGAMMAGLLVSAGVGLLVLVIFLAFGGNDAPAEDTPTVTISGMPTPQGTTGD